MQSNFILEGKILPLDQGYMLTAVCMTDQVKSTLFRNSSVFFILQEGESKRHRTVF